MKYIKTYEQNKRKFKIGDYVKVDSIISEVIKRVYKIDNKSNINSRRFYLVDIDPNYKDRDYSYFWEYIGNMKHASEKEIEDYKIKITVNKYNI